MFMLYFPKTMENGGGNKPLAATLIVAIFVLLRAIFLRELIVMICYRY